MYIMYIRNITNKKFYIINYVHNLMLVDRDLPHYIWGSVTLYILTG